MTAKRYSFANDINFSLWQQLSKGKKKSSSTADDADKNISLNFHLNSKVQSTKISSLSIDDTSGISLPPSGANRASSSSSPGFTPEASHSGRVPGGSVKSAPSQHTLDFGQAAAVKAAKGMQPKSTTGFSAVRTSKPILNHLGIVHLTTKSKSNYTIGKKAKLVAANNLDYISREESNAVVRDKLGNPLSKEDIAQYKQKIYQQMNAERRLVFSPDSRIQLTEEQHSRLVREVMLEYGHSLSKEFDFVFSTHGNTDNMHTHVLMLSKHANGDGIKMYKDEVFEMKNIYYEKMHEHLFNVKSGHRDFTDHTLYQKAYETALFNNHIKQDEATREKIIERYDPKHQPEGWEFYKYNRHLVLADFLAERNGMQMEGTGTQFLKSNHDLAGAYYDENKNLPSPAILSRAMKLMDKSEVEIDRSVLESRQQTIRFVKEFDASPLKFSCSGRQELLSVLMSKREAGSIDSRLEGLITRVKTMQEITVDSLNRNSIVTGKLESYSKSIEIDAVSSNDIENILDAFPKTDDVRDKIMKLLRYNPYLSVSYLENQGFSRTDIESVANISKTAVQLEIADLRRAGAGAFFQKNTPQEIEKNLGNSIVKNVATSERIEKNIARFGQRSSMRITGHGEQNQGPGNTKIGAYQRIDTERLNYLSNQDLTSSDPEAVLQRLGIAYKSTNNGNRYEFKVRDERTASANMYLAKSGTWVYNDFGGRGGSVIQLVMDAANKSYGEAREFAFETLGVRDRTKEAFEELRYNKESKGINEEELKAIRAKMQANSYRSQAYDVDSKVVQASGIDDRDPRVADFLERRGFEIDKMPSWAKMITGEYKSFDSEGRESVKTRYGIGVLFDNGGGDIHYLKPMQLPDGKQLKTMSFGNKDITTIEPEVETDIKSFAIFESKNDAIAAYHQIEKLKEQTILIANGTGSADKIIEAIKERGFEQGDIYNQNDRSGALFLAKLMKSLDLDEYRYIEYKSGEYKMDVNDLHKEGEKIEDRFEAAGKDQADEIIERTDAEKESYDLEQEQVNEDQQAIELEAEGGMEI